MAQGKEEVFFAVCNSILKMQVSKGHLNWSFTDISRDSGITRSLIYYYFGKDKELVLQEAYRFVIARFFNTERVGKIPVKERMKQILTDLRNMPYLLVLYYLEKNKKTEFSALLEDAEKKLLKVLAESMPGLTEAQVLQVYLKQIGAIVYHLSEDETERIFTEV